MPKLRLRHAFVAAMVMVAMLSQGTWALAGTTGNISGTLTDTSTGKPVADAKVSVVSASQSAQVTTNAGGHFNFLTLLPDTYTVSAAKDGYAPASVAGVTVLADQTVNVALDTHPELKTIANITSRAAGNLVKPGTTSDVYSVNAASQEQQQASAGGYNLNSAYSAIYNQPGVQGAIGNYGVGQVFYIRGSAYSQVGYEYDGVPVNRAFDNYNANSLSNLGQQELQVYTGGSPAGASSATLGGFINQVIKSGTYPGTGTLSAGLGSPNFYHSLKAEAGGASPNRLFSYYVGLSGYNQVYPWINDKMGGDLNPDGSNQFGLAGGEVALGPPFFLSTARGPWPECQANGSAPTGAPVVSGLATCVSFMPLQTSQPYTNASMLEERDSVVNLHFGIPHKHDSGRDDVQLLFDNFSVPQYFNDSINNEGGLSFLNSTLAQEAAFLGGSSTPTTGGVSQYPNLCSVMNSPVTILFTFNALTGGPAGCNTTGNPFTYADGAIFGPGTTFGQLASTATVVPYLFPFSNNNRTALSPLPLDLNDNITNDGSIAKLQYTKNIGDNAYVRLYGYTFYSDWLQSGAPQAETIATTLGEVPDSIASADYELSTHTRGGELDFADQLNDQHLLTFTGNYTTASVVRWNNFQAYQGSGYESLLSGFDMNQPTNLATFTNGVATCYDATTGAVASCFDSASQGTYAAPVTAPWSNATTACAAAPLSTSPACVNGATFMVTAPGGYGLRNAVQPKFTSLALTDEFKPNDKLDLNLGVRYENYQYGLENTDTISNQFWFNAAANTYCYDPGTGLPILTAITPSSPTQSPQILPNTVAGQSPADCYVPGTTTAFTSPSGQAALHPNGLGSNLLFTPVSPGVFDKHMFSPRFGMTWTLSPDNVIRASYGRYSQPTETAFEQYTGPSGAFVSSFLFTHFWGLGFHDPAHDNPVQVSNNADVSWEHHFKGTDWTLKLTPYYRYTKNQLITVSLGGNFASGINAATQKSTGVELAISKGDPTRDGWSGQLAYTYSDALQKYAPVGGSNAIDVLNQYVCAFDALTSAGAPSTCPTGTAGTKGSPFYCVGGGPNGSNTGSSTSAACGVNGTGQPLAIANPYYSYPQSPTLASDAWYPAYVNNPPNSVGSQNLTLNSPSQFTGWLSWKHQKLQLTLDGILQAGTLYGSPLDFQGYDPRTCTANQVADGVASDTPMNADYQACASTVFTPSGSLAVPNPMGSQMFATPSQYREPWQLNLGAQIDYDLTPNIKAILVLANVYNHCFGGQKAPGVIISPNQVDCGWNSNTTYLSNYYYGSSPTNAANGTAGYPGIFNQTYSATQNGLPFQAYFNVQVKL